MVKGVVLGVAMVAGLLVGGVEGSLLARAAVMGKGSERNAESPEFCCALLSFQLGSKVIYPADPTYKAQSSSYWSLQESTILPTCRLTPASSQDVSTAISILSKHHCSFAIRGGGHMAWAGAANIQEGVTIDMSAMASVEVSEDRKVVKVGAGARWGDVYRKLEVMGLGVSGGRVADVGVAGLIIGGGLSFFSPRFGFVCDTVVNFEIVLANGLVTNANATSNPDLYLALKGGSNNFGIVTRFTLLTFPQGPLWGGLVISPLSTAPKHLLALEEFVNNSASDPFASVLNIYLHSPGMNLAINSLVYTKPEAYPKALKGFTDVRPYLRNTMRVTSLSEITTELAAGVPSGMRQLFGTATFGNNATLFADILNITDTVFAPLRSISNLQYTVVFQPIPTSVTEKAALTGGNVLGLHPGQGNLVWLDMDIQWPSAKDDDTITTAAQTAISQINARAAALGLGHDFIYLNYAFPTQDPIASYGDDNVALLRAAARKYDPDAVFQRLVPGGFKLWRDEDEDEADGYVWEGEDEEAVVLDWGVGGDGCGEGM